jgi:integrase/recombinase XerD
MIIDASHRPVSPLHPYLASFARWLARQGYTPISATFQLRLMARLDRWLARQQLRLDTWATTDLDRFLQARRTAGCAQYVSLKALQPLLECLREQGVIVPTPPTVPGPIDVVLARYRQYLTRERGLSGATIDTYLWAVRPFVSGLPRLDEAIAWGSLDAAAVSAFLVARVAAQSRGAAQLTATALRSLLRFLYADGLVARPLDAAVPAVARWRLAGLPKGLSPAQVRALLASCDRRTRTGRRDVAVLILLVRLGLRAGELARLHLDDIHWRTGCVVIRGKGRQVEPLPWPQDVGAAVAAYLRRGRPTTALDRTVFIRVKAPHHALSPSGVTQIVAAAAQRAGLGRLSAHRLRHTTATQLLRAGAPLPEIGHLLRHRRATTTAIYAKVDRRALRTMARPWPGGVA